MLVCHNVTHSHCLTKQLHDDMTVHVNMRLNVETLYSYLATRKPMTEDMMN